jgi:hypothetical protein
MEARMEEELRTACDDARLRASLALDGALVDDIGLHRLRSHLDACPACARLVARMGLAAALLRRAPLEPFRCEPPRTGLPRPTSATRGLPWATAAVAVAALALAGVSPPRGDAPDRLDQALPASGAYRHSVVPFRLPIGQRSAAEDFVARAATAGGRADRRADGAPRDQRIQ